MIILQRWAEINNIHTIAYGHHATDAIASLLKSFYMYQDRWECGHEEFTHDNFFKLICSQKKFYLLDIDDFIALPIGSKIGALIEDHKVGTDEPIFQYIYQSSIRLCRPLFNVFEREILDYFNSQSINFNESECFVTDYRDKRILTPREMIHYELLNNASGSLLEYLLELTIKSLDEYGFLKFNVRNHRTEILGKRYKDEKINNIKI